MHVLFSDGLRRAGSAESLLSATNLSHHDNNYLHPVSTRCMYGWPHPWLAGYWCGVQTNKWPFLRDSHFLHVFVLPAFTNFDSGVQIFFLRRKVVPRCCNLKRKKNTTMSKLKNQFGIPHEKKKFLGHYLICLGFVSLHHGTQLFVASEKGHHSDVFPRSTICLSKTLLQNATPVSMCCTGADRIDTWTRGFSVVAYLVSMFLSLFILFTCFGALRFGHSFWHWRCVM